MSTLYVDIQLFLMNLKGWLALPNLLGNRKNLMDDFFIKISAQIKEAHHGMSETFHDASSDLFYEKYEPEGCEGGDDPRKVGRRAGKADDDLHSLLLHERGESPVRGFPLPRLGRKKGWKIIIGPRSAVSPPLPHSTAQRPGVWLFRSPASSGS